MKALGADVFPDFPHPLLRISDGITARFRLMGGTALGKPRTYSLSQGSPEAMAALKLSPGHLTQVNNGGPQRLRAVGKLVRQLGEVYLSIGSRRPVTPSGTNAGRVNADILRTLQDRWRGPAKLTCIPDGNGSRLECLASIGGLAPQVRHPLTGLVCPPTVDCSLATDRARLVTIVLVNGKGLHEHLHEALGPSCIGTCYRVQTLVRIANLHTHLLNGLFRRHLQCYEAAERIQRLFAPLVERAGEDTGDDTEVP